MCPHSTEPSNLPPTTTTTTNTDLNPLLTALNRDGYVIIPAAIPPAQIEELRAAARRTAALARSGGWRWVRRMGKMFPRWEEVGVGEAEAEGGEIPIWGVQHLLHPSLPDAPTYTSLYFSDTLLKPVKQLLGLPEDDSSDSMLVMELFNMLIRPPTDFALRWHRDDVPFTLSPAGEAKALGLTPHAESTTPSDATNHDDPTPNGWPQPTKRKAFHAQYNIPLHPDTSLHLIPGSHLRPRTPAELSLLALDPCTNALPGAIQVRLQPGDVAFYDNDIIHRGVYGSGVERLTLHGSVGDVRAGGRRARNVLQHGVGGYVAECKFGEVADERVRARAEGMRARLVALGAEGGAEVGVSHED